MNVRNVLLQPVVRCFRSPLVRKMVVVIFLAIMTVESVMLIMSYIKREGELLSALKDNGTHWILATEKSFDATDSLQNYVNTLLHGPMIKGVAITSESGHSLATAGEPITEFRALSHDKELYHKTENRYETAWKTHDGSNPLTVVLRMDSAHVPKQLRTYALNIIGLTLIISAVLTLVTIVAVDRIVLRPLFQMRDVLTSSVTSGWAEHEVTAMSRNDEIGEFSRATADLIDTLISARAELEDRVEQRTEQLQHINAHLRKEEQRFRDFAGTSSDYFWETDTELRFTYLSERHQEVTGVASQDVLGKTLGELNKTVRMDSVFKYLLANLKAHRAFRNYIRTGPKTSGEQIHISINGAPIFDDEDTFQGYRGTGTDVTKIINASTRLEDQRQTLKLTLDALDQGVAMYDADLRLIAWNKQLSKLLDFPEEYLAISPTLRDLFDNLALRNYFPELTGDRDAQWLQWKERLKDTPHELPIEELRIDGSVLEVHTKRLPTGGLLRTFTDITERKRAAAKLAEIDLHLKMALANMSDGIFVLDKDLNYVMFNNRYLEMLEGPPDGIKVGMAIRDVIEKLAKSGHYGPGDPEAHITARMNSLASNGFDEIETTTLSGNILNVRKSSISDGGCVVTVRDITDLKHSETKLMVSEKELSKQSQLLQTTLDSIRQGFAVWDSDQRLVAWSQNCVDFWYHPDDILKVGMHMKDLLLHIAKTGELGEGDPQELARKKLRYIQTAGPNSGETLTLLDGRIIELRRHAMPEGGHAATYTDITERETIVMALRESEARFRAIMDNSPSYIYLKDVDGRYLLVNKHTEEGLGLSGDQIIGKTHQDFYSEELIQQFVAQDREVIDTRSSVVREIAVPDAVGEIRDLLINKFPILNLQEEVEALGAVIVDITDQKQAEKEIADKERQLRKTLDNMDSGILMMDSDLNIQIFNQRLIEMFQIPEGTIKVGGNLEQSIQLRVQRGDFGNVDPGQSEVRRVDQLRNISTGFTEEHTVRERTIQSRWVRSTDGSLVAVNSDITERKRAEAMLLEAKENAESVTEAKSEFVAVVSHEVRTPMNGMLGMAQLLQGTVLDEKQRQFVDTIVSSGDSLVRILNDLLDISKFEAGKFDLEEITFSPEFITQKAVSILTPKAEAAGLDLICILDPKVPPAVIGDPYRLEQIFLNLLSNAIKFTPKGKVTARVTFIKEERGRCELRFSVEDTGSGMTLKTQNKVFTPYAQGAVDVARKYGGTGLGLAISRHLVKLMGAEIKLKSKLGKGSTFWFDVSLVTADESAINTAQLHRWQAFDRKLAHPVGPVSVLQIEDNETNRKVVESILQRAGHSVISVEDGALAEESVRNGNYDIVIMDRHMPKINGLEATKRIRNLDPPKGDISIIGLTAGTTETELAACIKAGMNAVLTKPVDGGLLLDRINELSINRPSDTVISENSRPLLVIDDIELNRTVTTRQLAKLGLTCQEATSGKEGLQIVQQSEFSAILVDISMPEMDGMEFTRQFRALSGSSSGHTPVIAMTGMATNEDKNRFLAADMDDVLTKPVILETLRGVLSRWLSGEMDKGKGKGKAASAATASPPIDFILLSEILADTDETFLNEVVLSFVNSFPQQLSLMDAALVGRCAQDLDDAAHAARSAASCTGATILQVILGEIEKTAANEDWAALTSKFETVKLEFDRVKAVCEHNNNRSRR